MAKKTRRDPASQAAVPDADAPGAPSFLRWTPQGCTVEVAVVPNARRTEVDGLHDGALKVRLAALPVEGAANEALQRWLADAVGVPRRQVSLLRGPASRRKTLAVVAEADRIRAWLGTLPNP